MRFRDHLVYSSHPFTDPPSPCRLERPGERRSGLRYRTNAPSLTDRAGCRSADRAIALPDARRPRYAARRAARTPCSGGPSPSSPSRWCIRSSDSAAHAAPRAHAVAARHAIPAGAPRHHPFRPQCGQGARTSLRHVSPSRAVMIWRQCRQRPTCAVAGARGRPGRSGIPRNSN